MKTEQGVSASASGIEVYVNKRKRMLNWSVHMLRKKLEMTATRQRGWTMASVLGPTSVPSDLIQSNDCSVPMR